MALTHTLLPTAAPALTSAITASSPPSFFIKIAAEQRGGAACCDFWVGAGVQQGSDGGRRATERCTVQERVAAAISLVHTNPRSQYVCHHLRATGAAYQIDDKRGSGSKIATSPSWLSVNAWIGTSISECTDAASTVVAVSNGEWRIVFDVSRIQVGASRKQQFDDLDAYLLIHELGFGISLGVAADNLALLPEHAWFRYHMHRASTVDIPCIDIYSKPQQQPHPRQISAFYCVM
ncbi:hypothetical protein BOTBODRAFT_28845 [Botryobasidium botryosum FD-172 SS1]|uniref:Uncharacterized protein n=1 Tax=Botryobasidium botryosum (strain FD-172 SS1) TaxID=930990 RepID=A0A067MS93_BOTB1|nr:hypothetical protein BOTBODRAFT_28845 [Botryobasidium botryosum FD-172 SS1]